MTNKDKVNVIAASLAYGSAALSEKGIRYYIEEQKRLLAQSSTHVSMKAKAKIYLEAGLLALKLKGVKYE